MTDDPAELPIKEYIARGVAEGALAAAQHVRLAVDQLAGRGRLGRHGVIGQHVLRRIGMPGVSQGVIDGPVGPWAAPLVPELLDLLDQVASGHPARRAVPLSMR